MTDTTAAELTTDTEAAAPELAEPPQVQSLPALIAEAKAGFLPVPLEQIDAVADRMHLAAKAIRPAFADNRDACWAVAYQASRWGMDPMAVLSKSYIASSGKTGGIGYEAQLIHALVNRFAPIKAGGMRFVYGYADPEKKTAAGRFVRVEATDARTGEVKSITTPTVAQIKVKNSPLWFSDPDQQLAYYGGRAFARRHYPEVLLGVYSTDEVQMVEVRDHSAPRARPLFEEDEPEPTDAEFSDAIPPTEADAAAFARWEKKASGEGDSRDPRDAPANNAPKNDRGGPSGSKGPEAPPQGESEPQDAAELRAWGAETQRRFLAYADEVQLRVDWDVMVREEKRWGRLKAYQPDLAKSIRDSVFERVRKIVEDRAAAAQAEGADTETGEV